MPLSVIVVGAGIGGLTAAVALSQAGHHVEIFEKSAFAGEVGAALLITPNGERVLSHLGFDFKRARADDMISQEVLDGITFKALHRADLRDARERFGAPVYTIHRVDLHDELMHLGTNIKLRLSSRVVDANAEAGSITLSDGSVHTADLIVAADGVHSVLRQFVLRDGVAIKSRYSGMNAFRFLIPTPRIKTAAGFEDLWKTKGKGASVLADTSVQTERHMVWYTARSGEVHNFAGIYEKLKPRTDDEDLKTLMLDEFGHYHPLFRKIIDMADDVTDWPLSFHDPLPWWHRGKILIIGDAAHPMLPFSGQGANQAIEDGGALGAIFHKGSETPAEVPRLLDLFENVRRLRASRIQTMSKVRMGREQEIQHELKLYADPPGSHVPDTFAERYQHDYIFDVFSASKQALDGEPAAESNKNATDIHSNGAPISTAPAVLAT